MKILRRYALSLLILFMVFTLNGQHFMLHEGDLLFQDLDCGPSCDAIEAVTQGLNGGQFSHVGMILLREEQFVVMEAISPGVVLTPLQVFLDRSSDTAGNPKVIVTRLKEQFQPLVPLVIKQVDDFLGKPYNKAFKMNSGTYYCSEMMYYLFTTANNDVALFDLYPMTFKQPGSEAFFPQWVSYFHELQLPIPEGEPGLNPGSMSRSDALELVHVYGFPDGWLISD